MLLIRYGKVVLKRAKFVADNGGEFVMIDFLTAGFAGFQTLRDECQDLGLAIHVHRAFHAAFTRNPKHGVSSGGLHPLLVSQIIKMLGNDIMVQCGGGVLGHPSGIEAGAMALRQAIDATSNNISLKEYAKTHIELKVALGKWGFSRPI